MTPMVIVNFYKPYDTTWELLQLMALDKIAEHEKETSEVEFGDVSVQQQFDDYRAACFQGLKTFIMQVLNEWGTENILVFNDKFYKKFEHMEMEGRLKTYTTPNVFKTSKELFKCLKKEKFQLEPDDFDFIHETFSSADDVVCNIFAFEYELKEIDDDKDWLDENGFGDILE